MNHLKQPLIFFLGELLVSGRVCTSVGVSLRVLFNCLFGSWVINLMTYWMGAGNANVWCILRDFCRINRALFGLVSYNDPWNSGIL